MFRTFTIFGILASLAIAGALPAHALVSLNGVGDNGREINGVGDNGLSLNGGGDNGITRNGTGENGTGENGSGENGSGENGIVRNGGGTNGDAGETPAGSSALSIQAFELPPERK
jgi:hypothetical protein